MKCAGSGAKLRRADSIRKVESSGSDYTCPQKFFSLQQRDCQIV